MELAATRYAQVAEKAKSFSSGYGDSVTDQTHG
jgi:hypothetical protein